MRSAGIVVGGGDGEGGGCRWKEDKKTRHRWALILDEWMCRWMDGRGDFFLALCVSILLLLFDLNNHPLMDWMKVCGARL